MNDDTPIKKTLNIALPEWLATGKILHLEGFFFDPTLISTDIHNLLSGKIMHTFIEQSKITI